MRDLKLWAACTGLILTQILYFGISPASAQNTEVKEKPPMYSYIAVWNIPRIQWKEREPQASAAKKILDRAIAANTIVAYGFDENPLHDTFWLAMSRSGLQNVLQQFKKAGFTAAPPSPGATAPPVSILVSRYYNWHPGTWKNAYVHVGIYKLRPNAPLHVVDILSKNFFAPLLEKMLADGAIFEWETDTYADPKESPDTFLIAYLSDTEEGLTRTHKELQQILKSRSQKGPSFDSLVDPTASRDVVVRSYAVYK